MRVLLSCLQSRKRHALPAYEFWRPYFINGCREAGIECLEVPGVDWAEGLVHPPGPQLAAWRARTWDAVLAFARQEQGRNPIDFFLGYLYPGQVEVRAIADMQRIGIPCVNFFCDNVREFQKVPDAYRPFSLNWVPEFEALDMYREAGLPYLHAPMPCWVPLDLRSVPMQETEPPTFVGSADALRRELLGSAIGGGADIVVRGPGWSVQGNPLNAEQAPRRSLSEVLASQFALLRTEGLRGLICKLRNRLHPLAALPVPESRIRPAAFGLEYSRVTREAELIIGINRVPTARAPDRSPLSYSRLRDIEAPMLGACYLTEWTEGLGEMFELGVEIESYRTAEELCAKVAELKSDKRRRFRMRELAQRRALVDHTVARSLGRICERLGLQGET